MKQMKNHPITETKFISFRGLYNLLYFSVRKLHWHVLFFFILNIDHYILFAAKICILLLILHGLKYKPILALFRDITYPGCIPLHIALLCTSRFFKSLIFEFSTLST